MARLLVCSDCGAEIKQRGWRAYPAVVEGDHLAGTTVDGPVGPAIDLCVSCVKSSHPVEDDGGHEPSSVSA